MKLKSQVCKEEKNSACKVFILVHSQGAISNISYVVTY